VQKTSAWQDPNGKKEGWWEKPKEGTLPLTAKSQEEKKEQTKAVSQQK